MSVCFTCHAHATQRTANCVALAILIGTYQLVNDIRACSGNACVCSYTHLQAFIHETDAKWELQRCTAELQDSASHQAQSAIVGHLANLLENLFILATVAQN